MPGSGDGAGDYYLPRAICRNAVTGDEATDDGWLPSRACVAAAMAMQHPRNMPTMNQLRRNTSTPSPKIGLPPYSAKR